MDFSIIAALERSRGIGKDNDMPWHLPRDYKHFVETTKGGTVIMGRKTWESLPDRYRPLPDRLNIVVSKNAEYDLPDGVLLVSSLDEALSKAVKKVFVIGGANFFAQTIVDPRCNELILTQIDADFECDTFFPEIPEGFSLIKESPQETQNDINFHFLTYSKHK